MPIVIFVISTFGLVLCIKYNKISLSSFDVNNFIYYLFFSVFFYCLSSTVTPIILGIKDFHLKNVVLAIINSLTAIPPVCAGLICYLIVSRTGPLGWMGILYTPIAMMIAQFIIITPIMISLIARNIQEEYPLFEEELRSYGANLSDKIKLLLTQIKHN